MRFFIRHATPSDAESIVTFQLAMALETEGLNLDRAACRKGVQAVFADPAKGAYYVAENAGTLLGALLVIPEWSDWRNRQVWWIHSAYVRPEARARGVFRALYAYLRAEVARNPDLAGLRLYVDKRNKSAQAVYRALGMTDEHYHLFEWLK